VAHFSAESVAHFDRNTHKNRNAPKQEPVDEKTHQQQPENAKTMYTRKAEQEKANLKRIDRLSPDQQIKLDAIKERFEKATQNIGQKTNTPSPTDAGGSPEVSRQNMTGQDRTAPALSPTNAHAGQPVTNKEKSPSPQTEKKAEHKTLPRPQPSWER
jgi:hypothetical protein